MGHYFVVRASVVDGEVPLLLSRKALSTLGMVYDIEAHSTSFKHLGVENFRLLTTDNGHPAIQVNPRPSESPKLPSLKEWAEDEVKIFSFAREQYMAHSVLMTAVEGHVGSEHPVGPKNKQFPPGGPLGNMTPRIFYPEKIDAAVRHILCDVPLKVESFAAWWARTPISKDLWIETASSFVRVHVVPRKGFFDPSCWNTDQEENKSRLLAALGQIRSASAISRSNLSGMQQIHDTWIDTEDTSHPILWIGRTIFSRVTPETPCASRPSSPSDGVPEGKCVEHVKGATDGEGPGLEHHHPPVMVCRRIAPTHTGEEGGHGRHVFGAERACIDEQRAVGERAQAPGDTGSGGGHQGAHGLAHQGLLHEREGRCIEKSLAAISSGR